MSAPAPTAVHWTQPGLLALAEDDGHGDTCGPIVMLDYMHVKGGQALNYAATDALRSRLIADGLMGTTGGMTLGDIVIAMKNYYGVADIKYVSWGDYTVVLQELHPDIQAALEAHQLVILETHLASALPDNQAGVQNHFVLVGGIDSALGYYVCNGDTYTALAGGRTNPAQQPTWDGWGSLMAAEISSYAILPAVENLMLLLPQVSDFFTANPDGSWHCTKTGHNIKGGILDFYRNLAGQAAGMSVLRCPLTDEIPVGSPKAGTTRQPTFQIFEAGILAYDPDRVLDTPPFQAGEVYFWHLDRPQVEAVLYPTPPAPPAPAPQTPTVAFGVPTVAETNGAVVTTLPYTLGEK